MSEQVRDSWVEEKDFIEDFSCYETVEPTIDETKKDIEGWLDVYNKLWEKEKNIYNEINQYWIEKYASGLLETDINVKETNEICEHHHTCVCMDERTNWTWLNLAGSGLLLADSLWNGDLEKWINELARILVNIREENWDLKVSKISSHDQCGAAKIYANVLKERWIDVWEPDEFAKEFSKKLASRMNEILANEDKNVEYLHLEVTEPHNARSIYVDFTGNFNENHKYLPNWYNVSTQKDFLQDNPKIAEHITAQVRVAYDIATSDHCYWDRIDEKNPFFVFLTYSKENPIDPKIKEDIEKLRDELWDSFKIDYFEVK